MADILTFIEWGLATILILGLGMLVVVLIPIFAIWLMDKLH